MNTKPQVKIQTVTADAQGQRLDNYLLKHLKGVPKSHIYQIIRKGQVRINGKRAKPVTKLQIDDQVRIPPVRVATRDAPIEPSAQAIVSIEQAVLLDHDDFLLINKPANFAVHGGSGINYGVIDVLRHMHPDVPYELVHRLDKSTSGCLLIAKSRFALMELQNAWREDQVQKIYLAIVKGHLEQRKMVVKAPLLRLHDKVVVDEVQGKASKSTFTEVERYEHATLVRVQLHTGRMHQIRVHSQYLGHPIVGDEKYGDRDFNGKQSHKRLCLHAQQLQFHYHGETISVEAPWTSKA